MGTMHLVNCLGFAIYVVIGLVVEKDMVSFTLYKDQTIAGLNARMLENDCSLTLQHALFLKNQFHYQISVKFFTGESISYETGANELGELVIQLLPENIS